MSKGLKSLEITTEIGVLKMRHFIIVSNPIDYIFF